MKFPPQQTEQSFQMEENFLFELLPQTLWPEELLHIINHFT